jgi:hypothetical protein
MRTRFLAGIAVPLLGCIALAAPGAASAATQHQRHYQYEGHGLTIAATPDPITSGEGVMIYGQLHGRNNAGRRIVLFHRVFPAWGFSPVSITRTNAQGFYEFVRADGVVTSNRNWYVVGPYSIRSRTVHELVSSVVTLSTGSATASTGQQVTFTGTVAPSHPFQRVLLQEQNSSSGTGWQTVAIGSTNASSAFTITHAFRAAGNYTLRAYFRSDGRNIAGQSATIALSVEQTQNTSFTITGSAPVVTDGQTETITGTLYATGSTTVTQPNTAVMLYGKQANGNFEALASGTTDSSGDYSFTQVPLHNTVYRVETTSGTPVVTANLYIGVQDVVTISPSTTTTTVGTPVTVTGTVAPDHSGHVIYLQEQDAAGNWVDVTGGYVNASSMYSFTYSAGEAGTVQLRTQITGGPVNVGGVSSTISVTASGVAPASTLTPAS